MPTRRVLFFSISTFLLLSLLTIPVISKQSTHEDTYADDDEDLSFLEADDENDSSSEQTRYPDPYNFDDDDDDDVDDDEDYPSGSELLDEDEYNYPIDESHVVVLGKENFRDFIKSNRYVMVEFYAPWCGHCQALAPEYAAAARELSGENVTLAKVDATEDEKLAEQYEVHGFPTVYFFVDGDHTPYPGQRTKNGIVSWIKKQIGPGISNITTAEDAECILTSENKVVLGFFDSLVGPESEELVAASRLEDDVNFYQTVNSDVAKLFHMTPNVKRPALVLLKKEDEKRIHYDGQFVKSAIAEFVSANKIPLVTTFTRESASMIFESSIKKQLLLFATSNDAEKVIPTFQEAAKLFKGKLIFVYIEMDNEDVGRPVSDYFSVTGNVPKVLAYTGNDDAKKFILDGEVTLDKIKAFAEDFVEDKLKSFYMSDPIPETNDGDVKIVVGSNFDEIVLDESKDVLLEIYAPWCVHCQALEPTLNKLAKHLRGIESLVIAKMNGASNEHPRAKADVFPTFLFFPAGNRSLGPIVVNTDHTVVAFYVFLKKHASIPFKLQKPARAPTSEDSDAKESIKSATEDSDAKESKKSTTEDSDAKQTITSTTNDVNDEL